MKIGKSRENKNQRSREKIENLNVKRKPEKMRIKKL